MSLELGRSIPALTQCDPSRRAELSCEAGVGRRLTRRAAGGVGRALGHPPGVYAVLKQDGMAGEGIGPSLCLLILTGSLLPHEASLGNHAGTIYNKLQTHEPLQIPTMGASHRSPHEASPLLLLTRSLRKVTSAILRLPKTNRGGLLLG